MKQIDTYLQSIKSEVDNGSKSIHTLNVYEKDLNKFRNHFSLTDIDQLRQLKVDDYKSFYQSQKLSPTSVNGLIRSLSSFHVYLVDAEYIEETHAFFKVKFGKSHFMEVKKKKKVVLTPAEETMLINAGRNLQEMFMLSMMLKTALRRDEICNIKISDIHGCEITITGKGGDQATTYLDNDLCGMMSRYMTIERKTNSEYLFYGTRGESSAKMTGTSINNRVRECAKLSGIPEDKIVALTAHRLRGTAITRTVIKKGLFAGQMLARHANSATTQVYIEVGNEYVKELLLEGNEYHDFPEGEI